MTNRRPYQRAPLLTAPLVYASDQEISALFEPRGCESSPANKLGRLQDRLMDRTIEEVIRWVHNTNQRTGALRS